MTAGNTGLALNVDNPSFAIALRIKGGLVNPCIVLLHSAASYLNGP